MTIKSKFGPGGEPTGRRTITLQELSKKVSAMARRYGHNASSDEESDNPFVEQIAHTQFPERFKMPTIKQYKETRDLKEHVRRFRNIMAKYASNEGLLCLTFPQTFGDLVSKWFGRLPPMSIKSFSGFSEAFIRQFMGSVQRRKSLAHLSNLRQDKNESLKKYLTRFSKEVAQIEDASDVTVVAAFTNGENREGNRNSGFRSKYNSYTPLTGDQEDILSVIEDKELAKYPRQQSANARRDTIKYFRFHKDHGHDTSKCFQLRDHIESLIRDRHLKDFTLRRDKHGGRQDGRGGGQDRKREPKRGKEGWYPIVFTANDAEGIDAKPNDAIVVGIQIALRDVLRVMIDNGSSADILSARVYDELRLDRKDLEPFHVPLKGFWGAEVRSLRAVKVPIRFGTAPCRRTILLDFVVFDIYNWPYNALLARPFLNKARAVMSTYALKMKFPTEFGIGELRDS
ncbi:hypothetical protein QYF36_011744 [Acer negundo]|nr:hypothetical protein QYF36_011744 [Acer negundo]